MGSHSVIPAVWNLPAQIISRFGEKAGRQRLMTHDGHILLVLHELPSAGSSERQAVLFWRNPQGEWKTTMPGAGLPALKEHVKSYDDAVDALDRELDTAESAQALFRILNAVTPIYRASKNLHRVLQKLRESLKEDKVAISLRDQAYEVERSAELLKDDAKNALDYSIARRSEEQSKQSKQISMAAHRLNMLVALFLPITAIASILGTSLNTGLENVKSPILFWGIMTVGLVLGFVLRGMISHRTE